jgi:alpha-1,2-mannosyltransferase
VKSNQVGRERRERAVRLALQALVFVVAAAYLAFGLATASYTLGCDFLAYHQAAQRFLAGTPIYDLSITHTGDCGVYQYPPPFVLIALPFSLLGFAAGTWAWIVFLVACFTVGTFVLPVRREIRWAIVLLGAVSWPFIFGVRIGQVGPILYLIFAIGWRYVDRPGALGAMIGVGTLVKVQPALLLGWLVVRRDFRALAAGLITIAVGVVAAAAVGLGSWGGFLTVIRNLSDALTVPTNLSLGATVYARGFGLQAASAIQLANTVALVGLVAVGARALSREAGYLLAVVASQAISPILWDHYALILLLPVAWLLNRRQWWAAVIPASQAWVLVPYESLLLYTAAFYVVLLAIVVVGWERRPRQVAVAPA